MAEHDMKVATFSSQFVGGNVELWYCPHGQRYELRYAVRFRTSVGFCNATALCAYDAGNRSQVADLLLDAIGIARTPLLDRD